MRSLYRTPRARQTTTIATPRAPGGYPETSSSLTRPRGPTTAAGSRAARTSHAGVPHTCLTLPSGAAEEGGAVPCVEQAHPTYTAVRPQCPIDSFTLSDQRRPAAKHPGANPAASTFAEPDFGLDNGVHLSAAALAWRALTKSRTPKHRLDAPSLHQGPRPAPLSAGCNPTTNQISVTPHRTRTSTAKKGEDYTATRGASFIGVRTSQESYPWATLSRLPLPLVLPQQSVERW